MERQDREGGGVKWIQGFACLVFNVFAFVIYFQTPREAKMRPEFYGFAALAVAFGAQYRITELEEKREA
jgi:lipopolysaccharide export LptBFGC system permease protein LptF